MYVISHVMPMTKGSCNDIQHYELIQHGSFASFCGLHHDKQFSVLRWCHVSVDGTIIILTFCISVMQLLTTKVNKTLNMHAKCHSLGDSQKYYLNSTQEEKNNY